MAGKHLALAAAAALVLGAAGPAAAAGKSLAPIPEQDAASTHSPFDAGECGLCHDVAGGKPGKLIRAVPNLCFDCHEEFKAGVKGHKAKAGCTGCHSPHNAKKKKLLL